MSALGIGLAFLMFWSLSGVGLYLMVPRINRLRAQLFTHTPLSNERAVSAGGSITLAVNIALLLLGGALVFEGLYLTYNVLFR